jgi:hypothetical protein
MNNENIDTIIRLARPLALQELHLTVNAFE